MMYQARYFRILLVVSILVGINSGILHMTAIAKDEWIIVESNQTEVGSQFQSLEKMISGIWLLCYENYYLNGTMVDRVCYGVEKELKKGIDSSQTLSYVQSLKAFELISLFAIFTGNVIAAVALVLRQPLAVLVAGFTMLFSGLFMLVGHVMVLSANGYGNLDDGSDVETNSSTYGSYFGWSCILAWISFSLCLISGLTLLGAYRYSRKLDDYPGATPPGRVKQLQKPVNVGSTL